MGFFGEFFSPPEAKLVRLKVKTFFSSHGRVYSPAIESSIEPLLRNTEALVKLVREEKRDPDELALSIIYNQLSRFLESGDWHTYRGMLSGTGQEALSLWNLTCKELLQKGFVKEDDVNVAREQLMDAIKSMG